MFPLQCNRYIVSDTIQVENLKRILLKTHPSEPSKSPTTKVLLHNLTKIEFPSFHKKKIFSSDPIDFNGNTQ